MLKVRSFNDASHLTLYFWCCTRHFTIADGVTNVRFVGLSLINGASTEDAGGGCVRVGRDSSLSLLDVSFRNCMASGSIGRVGAVFVGAGSTLRLEDSKVADCSAGYEGGGVYLDELSRVEMSRSEFRDTSSGFCPNPISSCQSSDWADSTGDTCETYISYPRWCGWQESSDECCVCGGGTSKFSCEPAGSGGALFAAMSTSITLQAVEFQNCSSARAGGAAYLGFNVTAIISSSRFLDCQARDGGAMDLHGNVSLCLTNVDMHRNHADRGGALNVASAHVAISMHGSTIINNSAVSYAGGIYLTSTAFKAANTSILGNTAAFGAGMVGYSASIMLTAVSFDCNIVSSYGAALFLSGSDLSMNECSIEGSLAARGAGIYAKSASSILLRASTVTGNTGAYGAGFYLSQSELTCKNSSIQHNTATQTGGGLISFSKCVINLIAGASVSHNHTSSRGGGMYLQDSSMHMMESSTIWENEAANGGGVYSKSCVMVLTMGSLMLNTVISIGLPCV